jgi:hypothetical protein
MRGIHYVTAAAAPAIAGALFSRPGLAQRQPTAQAALVQDVPSVSDKYTGLARVIEVWEHIGR